ncbi:hypothetical protein OH809_25645 [Streptomyces sp. NBC_00873]|uniref:hypothetical protein n=1 Tax=unclassified Streptomyces TaxID=2593676 RepID=UPI00386383A0|nr:hypothetical protein OH809_25645 [Streptomyces sp. NBC_00873]WTA44342.1 hypothetical protein OH821_18325 [Streptomyces sp. NBC_00842]
MSAGRGDRAAPPALEGHGEVRFADAAAAKGWESLAQQARENTYRAWVIMRTDPGPATETPRRLQAHPLAQQGNPRAPQERRPAATKRRSSHHPEQASNDP